MGVLLLVFCSFAFPGCTEMVSANACSTGGLISVIESLPTGGIADLRACGSMSLAGPIRIGTATAPVTLLLGTGTITFTNPVGNGFQIGGNGSRLIGQGSMQTILRTAAGFTGDVVDVEPVSELTTNGVEEIELANFECDVATSPAAICIHGVAVRHGSTLHNLRLMNMTGTALELTTSPLQEGRISNITSVRDTYIQTAASALTADTVILKGNAIQFDSNNTIFTPSQKGPYRGLVISPSSTNQGDGRGNNVAHSVIEGYGICLSVESPPGPNTGAIGTVVTANWFEECGLAYQFTGADAGHMAINNHAFANYFASSTVNIARLDFAHDNSIDETTNGNPGTVTLTNNSSNNSLFVHLGNPGDISDLGSENVIYSTLSKNIYLNGDLHVGGTLYKAAGSFRIDDPLDPGHKYLQHSFVESPDMMDIYNGVITLGESGAAEIQLPSYFEALNRDFRYQLTPIGRPASLYIAKEIANNRFTIAGGRPGLRVSWQVTGIRHDAYANRHRIVVVTEKATDKKGPRPKTSIDP